MDTITIWHRTAADGTSGWEAVTVAAVVTHHSHLMTHIWQVQEVLNNMMDTGMMAPSGCLFEYLFPICNNNRNVTDNG